MPHEVIMPALGMAQETGLIVSWLKAPGDAVAKGEALLEVETDKATMEVEAAADGFLSDVRAGAGDDVPVGQVIALIAETADAVVEGGGSADKAAAEEIPAAEAAAPAPLPPEVPVAPTHVAPVVAGRVLASPKARRLAAEQGLDLAALAGAGHPQPFHVRDLDAARALAAKPAAAGASARRVAAELDGRAFAEFAVWAAAETGLGDAVPALLARFAAAALRDAPGPLTVRVDRFDRHYAYTDPDRGALAETVSQEADRADLLVRDLRGSGVCQIALGAEAQPVLSLSGQGPDLSLTLECGADQLSPERALSLVRRVAGRLSDPLSHLL